MTYKINIENRIYHLTRENNSKRQNAMTFSCLGKLGPTNYNELTKWENYLKSLIHKSTQNKPISSRPLIIGLTESGIVPSALFHQILRKKNIDSWWVCSTRRDITGICFSESHSHGPDHILPIPDIRLTELWFVEDELTTGKTVLNLALNLCKIINLRTIRIFAIADTRTKAHKIQLKEILKQYEIEFSINTLFEIQHENGYEHEDESLYESINIKNTILDQKNISSKWLFPNQRPALSIQQNITLPPIYKALKGSLLVIGEAIDIAFKLSQLNPDLYFHHITLSPWQIDKKNILNRLGFGGKYFLYNYQNLNSDLYILYDPIDIPVKNIVQEAMQNFNIIDIIN